MHFYWRPLWTPGLLYVAEVGLNVVFMPGGIELVVLTDRHAYHHAFFSEARRLLVGEKLSAVDRSSDFTAVWRVWGARTHVSEPVHVQGVNRLGS